METLSGLYLTYSILLFLAGTLSIILMLIAWRRRRRVECAFPLAIFNLGAAIWSLTYALHWLESPRPSEYFWIDMTYFGVVTVPTAFFAFALCYSDRAQWLTKPVIGLMMLEPLLTLIFLWSDSQWGIFFAGKRQFADAVIYDGGVWFWFHVIYSYSLILYGMVVMFLAFIRYPQIYRGQIGMMILGVSVPWVISVISVLGYNPAPNLDLTPFAFSITGLFISTAIFRFRFLDLRPIAHDILFDNLSDAVIVLDNENRIVELNPRANHLLRHIISEPIGHFISDVQELIPENISTLEEGRAEINYSLIRPIIMISELHPWQIN